MTIHTRVRFALFAAALVTLLAPRVFAEDCNANGVNDCDDIDAGMEDVDNDDILDSCERALGDVNLDGQVNGLDLGTLLGSWGDIPLQPNGCSEPAWGTVLEWAPNPTVVVNATLRDAITATGLPWRVRDNASNIEMLLVPPGTFNMGCSASNWFPCGVGEYPVHEVTLTNAFYIGRTEVTQAQWTAEMGSNPSQFRGFADSPSRPLENVSWSILQPFLTQNGLRLPTEAEWEYAYRAGTTTAFHSAPGYPNGTNYDGAISLIANSCEDMWCPGETIPVALTSANGFGLHDMSGNVGECVSDWYGPYSSGAAVNPPGATTGSYRVLRGGPYNESSNACRASSRGFRPPTYVGPTVGFRVARNP